MYYVCDRQPIRLSLWQGLIGFCTWQNRRSWQPSAPCNLVVPEVGIGARSDPCICIKSPAVHYSRLPLQMVQAELLSPHHSSALNVKRPPPRRLTNSSRGPKRCHLGRTAPSAPSTLPLPCHCFQINKARLTHCFCIPLKILNQQKLDLGKW